MAAHRTVLHHQISRFAEPSRSHERCTVSLAGYGASLTAGSCATVRSRQAHLPACQAHPHRTSPRFARDAATWTAAKVSVHVLACATTEADAQRCVLQGDAWEVAPVPAVDVRSRCTQVHAFCDLLISQCMTDKPVEFRQMSCTACAVKPRGLHAVRPRHPRSSTPPDVTTVPCCVPRWPGCSCISTRR